MISNITHKSALIKCPHCKAEYLPGEIYMSHSLIGQPGDAVRDSLGKLIYADYDTPDREPEFIEHFVCEFCDKPFIIEATVTYKTMTEAPENDFHNQYVSLLD